MFAAIKNLTGNARFVSKYAIIGGKIRGYTFFNDGDGGSPPTPPPSPPVPPPTPKLDEKIFSQVDLDKKFAEHRKGLQQQNQELVTQLEDLKKGKGLSEQEKESLQERIDQLNNQHLSDTQKLKADQDKLQKKYDTDTKNLSGERDNYKNLFNTTMVNNALILAATKNKAAREEQIIMMFGSQAKVIQLLDDSGKITGKYDVHLPVEVEDPKTKKKETIELPASEALAKIKEDPRFFNLFLDTQGNGIGGGNSSSGTNGVPDFKNMTPEQYRAYKLQQRGGK